jgi:hypothetical protein
VPGFSARYGADRLVWFETYDNPSDAIAREKALKRWAGLEDPADRTTESGLAGSVSGIAQMTHSVLGITISVIPGRSGAASPEPMHTDIG